MAEPNKKRVYKTTDVKSTLVDWKTGEVKEQSEQHTEMLYAETEPAYIKIYIDTILKFKGISSSLNPILISLCKHMNFADGGQIVYVNKYVKERICEDCNVSIKRVEQAVRQFTEGGILMRVSRGVYRVNPYIISRGSWEDIKVLRGKFDFMTGEFEAEWE